MSDLFIDSTLTLDLQPIVESTIHQALVLPRQQSCPSLPILVRRPFITSPKEPYGQAFSHGVIETVVLLYPALATMSTDAGC